MLRVKTVAILSALLSVVLMSGVVQAQTGNNGNGNAFAFAGSGNNGNGPNSSPTDVPELSLTASGAACVLLVGGTLVARGRRRRRAEKV